MPFPLHGLLNSFSVGLLLLYFRFSLILPGFLILLIMMFQTGGERLEDVAAFVLSDGRIYLWDGRLLVRAADYKQSDWEGYFALKGSKQGSLAWQNGNNILLWERGVIKKITNAPEGVIFDDLLWSNHQQLAMTAIKPGNSYRDIYIWDGQKLIHVGHRPGDNQLGLHWSTDGRLAWHADGEVHVWDGVTTTNISNHSAGDHYPQWSDDGRLAWTSHRDGNSEIYVWDGDTVKNISQNPERLDAGPLWSNDGRLAWHSAMNPFSSDQKAYLHVWENGRTQIISDITLDIENNVEYAWASDSRLAWEMYDGHDWEIFVWNGENSVNLSQSPSTNDRYPAWSEEGQLVWQSENTTFYQLMLWDGNQRKSLAAHSDLTIRTEWLDDGRLLWWVYDDGPQVHIWQPETGEQIKLSNLFKKELLTVPTWIK